MSHPANRPHHTNRKSNVSHAVSDDGQSSHTPRPRAVLERAVSEDEMPQAGTTSQNSTTQTKPAASNKYSASRKDPTAHRDTRRFVDFVKEKRGLLVFSVILALLGVLCSIVPFLAAYGLLVMLWEGSANLPLILLFIAGGLVFFYARILLLYISTRRSHTAAFFVMEQLRIAITKKITRLPLGSTQEKGSGFYKNLLVDEIERLEYPMAHAIPETTSNTLLPLLVITTMYFFDWRLGLAMTLPVLLTLGLYIPAFRSIMAEFSRTYYAAADRMNARVIEYILGIKEVKIFNRVEDVYSHFVDSINHYEALTLRLYKRMWGVSSIAEVLLLSITAIIIAVGGLLFALGEIGLSVYLLAIFLSLGIGQPLLKFNEFLYNLFHISNGARMVDEALALPELSQTASSSVPLPNYELSFRNVSFSYGNGQVLSEVSLLFPAGKKTALVGPSGSGKSTIANLAARFWDVGEGSITLGGVDIRALPLSAYGDHQLCYAGYLSL